MTKWPDPCGAEFDPRLNFDKSPDLLRFLLDAKPCEDAGREIRRLGLIIDLADDCGLLDFLHKALKIGTELLSRESIAPRESSIAHYFLSNAWEGIRRHSRTRWDLYAWEQPELAEQIVHLRSAVRLGRESRIDDVRLCQMYTNLGNLLNHCGRVVEAFEAWDNALRIDSNFAMALGNRGYGLFGFAKLSHDIGHQACLLREAHHSLTASLVPGSRPINPQALSGFEKTKKEIEAQVPENILDGTISDRDYTEGWTKPEREYRFWCLRNRLFLNDLNEIDLGPIAAADVLTLPSITTNANDPQPSEIGFFNQMKQEYTSSRFLLFDATKGREAHFSDRNVTLINTLDYPVYGLAVEILKLSFRSSYSLFDKIAFFLNHYLGLSIPERRVSFRSLWYKNGNPKNGIRGDIGRPSNLGLKGLFWVSKDLYVPDPNFAEAIEPDAQLVATVRNHLEHKYLKVHDWVVPDSNCSKILGFEELAYSLTRRDLEIKTLRLLKLSRSALFYLVQAVYAEELRRHPPDDDKIAGPIFLDTYEDDWKV